jgi:large subunit ribosomal protein L18e
MGIQNYRRMNGGVNRTSSASPNLYLALIIKVYRFLSRRTHSRFNKTVLKRLFMSRKNQSNVSISKINKIAKKNPGKTIVVVGKILNDERIDKISLIKVCALSCSVSAKNRIEMSGGEFYTFGKFSLKYPTGKNSILLRGSSKFKKKKNKKNLK